MKKGVGYCRYSTDHQTENSIAYQTNAIVEYCNKNNIDLVHIFSDEAETGTNTDRPGFQSLCQSAKFREFDCIIFYDTTRLSRDVADWFLFRKDMMQLGIQLYSCTQDLGDIMNASNFLTELITVGLGQHMVLETRAKSIAGVREVAKKGLFTGGTVPFGYQTNKEGYFEIVPDEALAVRHIHEAYVAGDSLKSIADWMNARGYKTRHGKQFTTIAVRTILCNEKYAGIYTYAKEIRRVMRKWVKPRPNPDVIVVENAIPPIVSEELKEKVRQRMHSVKKQNARNKAKRVYLLSGLIECEKCGATYTAHTSNNKYGKEYSSYICGNKYRGKTCDAQNIRTDKLEAFVIASLKNYLREVDFDDLAQYIANEINNATPSLKEEKAELAEINKKIANGVNALLNGMDIPELKEQMDMLRLRKSELEDIIKVAETIRPKQLDPAKIVDMFKTSVDELENCSETRLREIIHQHVTSIIANVDGTFTINLGVHLNGCGDAYCFVREECFFKNNAVKIKKDVSSNMRSY